MSNGVLDKIKEFLNKLFAKLDKKPSSPVPAPGPVDSTPAPTPQVPTPAPNKPAPSVPPVQPSPAGHIDPTGNPPQTDLTKLTITSILWKPISDTNPVVSVVTISTDTIRSGDLRLEIFDKNGNLIDGLKTENIYSNGRGNGPIPGHKYARINFKPGKTDKQYLAKAPIKVTFRAEVGGKSYPVTIMGKDSLVLKDPTKRVDLK